MSTGRNGFPVPRSGFRAGLRWIHARLSRPHDALVDTVLEVTAAADAPEPFGIRFVFGEEQLGTTVHVEEAHTQRRGVGDGGGIAAGGQHTVGRSRVAA